MKGEEEASEGASEGRRSLCFLAPRGVSGIGSYSPPPPYHHGGRNLLNPRAKSILPPYVVFVRYCHGGTIGLIHLVRYCPGVSSDVPRTA